MKSNDSMDTVICHGTPFLVCVAVFLSGYVWDYTGNLTVSLVVLAVVLSMAFVAMHLANRVHALKQNGQFRVSDPDSCESSEPSPPVTGRIAIALSY
ncbi:MAG: hypothetical protein KDB27_10805 [Planctomycetales bacterium]|nr:hypothetical protein [Planctomycetales bacterium]